MRARYVSLGDLMLAGAGELKKGVCYFALSYAEPDQEMHYPIIETRIYIATGTSPGRKPDYYFRDPGSFATLKPDSRSSARARRGLVVMGEDVVKGMFDLAGLAEALRRLADS